MSSRRRAALATIAGSSSNTLVVSVQAVVLIPLYLHAIGPRLYGAWLGSGDILVWMQALDLGLPNLMIQRIGAAHGRKDWHAVAEYFATGMLSLGAVALLVTLAAVWLSSQIPAWMGLLGDDAHELRLCFLIGSVAAALFIVNNGVVGLSRGIQDTVFMNVVTVAASSVSFAVSLGLILGGWGLWAIALGLLARAGVSLLGSSIFVCLTFRGSAREFLHVRRSLLREFATITPAAALGGISYALMNQSESALVAILIRPELATVFTLTRKLVDVARSVVDTIAFGTYGGFAHLVASDQRDRALQIHAEITALRLSLAVPLAAAYMAVNRSFLALWVGGAQYGGSLLTVLLGLRFIILGGSYLINYLYRATGPIVRGSLALAVEGASRIVLMIALLGWLGLPGIPLAGIATSILSWRIVYHWTLEQTKTTATRPAHTPWFVWIVRGAVLAIGVTACVTVHSANWLYVALTGPGIALVGVSALVGMDPALVDTRRMITGTLTRLAPGRAIGV